MRTIEYKMSAPEPNLTSSGFDVRVITDPRVTWDSPTFFAAVDGPDTLNQVQFAANTASPMSGVTVSANFDQKTGIQKDIYMKYYVQVTLTGADSGSPLLRLGLDDAPRFMPVHSCAQSINVTINSSTFSQDIGNFLDAIHRYKICSEELKGSASRFPCMQDTMADYDDYTTLGTYQNPLGQYGESENARGGFPIEIISNTNTQAVVRFISSEPLISPWVMGDGKYLTSIANVTNVNVNVNLSGGMLNRVWSHAPSGNPLVVSNVEFYRNPELRLSLLAGNALSYIPPVINYPFTQFTLQRSPAPLVLASGARTQFSLGNIVLNGIPDSILIFIAKPFSQKTITDPDTYASIDEINIRWSTQTIWNGANSQDLYAVSQQNGLRMSYPAFSSHVGSVIRLTAADLNLNFAQAGGTTGSYSLTVDAWGTNLRSNAESLQLFCVIVNEGVVKISTDITSQYQNPISREEYVAAKRLSPSSISYQDYKSSQQLRGSGFWSSVGNMVKKVAGPAMDLGLGFIKNKMGLGGVGVGGIGTVKRKGGYPVGGASTSASALRNLVNKHQ